MSERSFLRLCWAVILLAVLIAAIVLLTGETRDMAFGRCRLAANPSGITDGGILTSYCMEAAGYKDICGAGIIPACYVGANFITRMRATAQ